jgi:trimethylamine:corrinoid methyltransferase-like protein
MLDLIDRIGPGGEFVSLKETARHCRFEIWQPSLMDRQTWATWEAEGGLTMEQRIRKRLLEILETHHPAPLPAGSPNRIEEILAQARARTDNRGIRGKAAHLPPRGRLHVRGSWPLRKPYAQEVNICCL